MLSFLWFFIIMVVAITYLSFDDNWSPWSQDVAAILRTPAEILVWPGDILTLGMTGLVPLGVASLVWGSITHVVWAVIANKTRGGDTVSDTDSKSH